MLLAVCQEFGIEVDENMLHRMAFGFAGGIGNTGAVCGAVAGGVMAIGLQRGRATDMDGFLRELQVSAEFKTRFENEKGTSSCRELTGLDLTQVEGIQDLMAGDTAEKVCFPAVAAAYRIVVELLRELEAAK